MNTTRIIFLMSLLLAICFMTKGQNFSYEIKIDLVEPDINEFDSSYTHTCVMEITDSSNISSIYIRAGKTQNTSNLIDQVFEFDKESGLPNGYTYNRHGQKILIGLGNHPSSSDIYYEIKLKDTLQNYGLPVYWQF